MRLLFGFVLITILSCGQASINSEKIRVTGEGKVRVKPDQVILTIDVSFVQPRMYDAVRLSQETVDSVVDILKRYKFSEGDIKTSSVTANKHYVYNGREDVFRGFNARQSIDFVLNDINKFPDLTGELLATKISSIRQVQFLHSRADSLFREADLLAYDDAIGSARKLCKRAGKDLGKLLFVSNAGINALDEESHQYNEMNTYGKAFGGRGFKIAPEVLEFRRSIVAEYTIY